MPRLIPRLLFLPLFLSLLAGCSSYQLGSMLPPDLESVYMTTVVNTTGEPLLENEVTTAILSTLQRDGSLTLAAKADADAEMFVRITQYNLIPLSFARDNRSQPDQYRLELRAEVELVESGTGKPLVRSTVTGYDEFPLSGDLTQAKRIGLPGAADDLARLVVAAVTEAWIQ